MGHDAEEWRRPRSEFVEAAAKYDEYETFIERDEGSEDWYCNNGRYFTVGLIRWPYEPYRKCWILAPDSGTDAEPFSAMKTLFNKAWLWLPRGISEAVLETAEMHLSPPADLGLYWAKSHYQHWCWLLWFHWLGQMKAENSTEAARPSQKIVLAPFHCSADLIAQWGLDGSDGKIPESLSPSKQSGDATNKTIVPTKTKRSTERGEGRTKLIAALTKHHKYADGSSLNQTPVGNNELGRLAKVSVSTASAFFNEQFGGHKKYQAICKDATRLIAALKLLNREFSPHHLFGDNPPEEAVNPEYKGDRRRKPRKSESERD